jgi:hypothetical protein
MREFLSLGFHCWRLICVFFFQDKATTNVQGFYSVSANLGGDPFRDSGFWSSFGSHYVGITLSEAVIGWTEEQEGGKEEREKIPSITSCPKHGVAEMFVNHMDATCWLASHSSVHAVMALPPTHCLM